MFMFSKFFWMQNWDIFSELGLLYLTVSLLNLFVNVY